jgi:hypothetical protein
VIGPVSATPIVFRAELSVDIVAIGTGGGTLTLSEGATNSVTSDNDALPVD